MVSGIGLLLFAFPYFTHPLQQQEAGGHSSNNRSLHLCLPGTQNANATVSTIPSLKSEFVLIMKLWINTACALSNDTFPPPLERQPSDTTTAIILLRLCVYLLLYKQQWSRLTPQFPISTHSPPIQQCPPHTSHDHPPLLQPWPLDPTCHITWHPALHRAISLDSRLLTRQDLLHAYSISINQGKGILWHS